MKSTYEELETQLEAVRGAAEEALYNFKVIVYSDLRCGCDHCRGKFKSTNGLLEKAYNDAIQELLRPIIPTPPFDRKLHMCKDQYKLLIEAFGDPSS